MNARQREALVVKTILAFDRTGYDLGNPDLIPAEYALYTTRRYRT
jgi:hypothetical protein